MSWRLSALISGAILCVNLGVWHQPTLGLILGIIYLLSLLNLQVRFFSQNTLGEAWLKAGLKIILILSIIGAVAFYLDIFKSWFFYILIIILPLLKTPKTKVSLVPTQETTNPWLFVSLIFFLGLTWHYLVLATTQAAIRTPWQVTPAIVWALYFLASAVITRLAYQKSSWWLLIPYYLLTWSLLNLIYPLSFGFDSFIHQASEKILSLTGTLEPKPWYYLGQYSLVIWLEKILYLPLKQIDQWLMPILASLFLPWQFNKLAQTITNQKPWLWLLSLCPLFLTLPFFTYTTPQALANLWALLVILEISINLLTKNYVFNKLIALLTLAALLTHPLTGLPLLGAVSLYYFIFVYHGPRQQLYQYASAVVILLAVPTAFTVLSFMQNSGTSLSFNLDLISSLQILGDNIKSALPIWPRYIELLDLTYFWAKLIPVLSLLIIILAINKLKKDHQNLYFFIWVFSLITTSYLILLIFAKFPNLAPNEQFFYTARLWDLAKLWLWPLLIYGTYQLFMLLPKIFSRPILVIFGGATILTLGFYLSYPRLDLYNKDTAYNTTPNDLIAVASIANNAQEDYVVLANQAVSAAAIDLYGFNKYYQGNFYYPVPTGTNPLYQIYLEASEKNIPTREVIKKASDLAGVKVVYLILNQYWSGFDKLTAVADSAADTKWDIGEAKIKIYKYVF